MDILVVSAKKKNLIHHHHHQHHFCWSFSTAHQIDCLVVFSKLHLIIHWHICFCFHSHYKEQSKHIYWTVIRRREKSENKNNTKKEWKKNKIKSKKKTVNRSCVVGKWIRMKTKNDNWQQFWIEFAFSWLYGCVCVHVGFVWWW